MSRSATNGRPRTVDPIARRIRSTLGEAGVHAVALFGGPGCGKTSLIASTVQRLPSGVGVGVITCGAGVARDDRTRGGRARVVDVKLSYGGLPDAAQVRDALGAFDLDAVDLLLIENAGTLTLPGLPDLG